jgi:hypothetical protein
MEYTTNSPTQTDAEPAIVPGVAGAAPLSETLSEFALDVPHELDAVTVTFPALLPKFTTIPLVPWPDVMVAPDGTDHV